MEVNNRSILPPTAGAASPRHCERLPRPQRAKDSNGKCAAKTLASVGSYSYWYEDASLDWSRKSKKRPKVREP